MANRFLGEATTKVGDKSYTLRMDFNAMCEFEDATGRDAMGAFADMESGNASVKDIRAIVWAALREHHPEATLTDAGAILSENTDVLQSLMAAIAPDAGDMGNAPAPGKDKPKKVA